MSTVSVPSQTKKPTISTLGTSTPSGRLVTQSGHGFVLGDLIYKNTSNVWVKAIANSNAVSNDTFVTNIVAKVVNANSFYADRDLSVGLLGFRGVTSLVPTAYYLSQTTAGTLTSVEPTAGFRQQVGWGDNGTLDFYPETPVNLDGISSPQGSVITRIVENENYRLVETKTGCEHSIYVRIKENTLGAKTFNVELIQAGDYRLYALSRYIQAIESKNTLIGGIDAPILSFNKLLHDGYSETFGVQGVGGDIGTHSVLDNGAHYQNNNSGFGAPRYFNTNLLLKVETQNVLMGVNYAGNCMSQIGLVFTGLVFPL